jgi:uncharacterized membrane protein YgcG
VPARAVDTSAFFAQGAHFPALSQIRSEVGHQTRAARVNEVFYFTSIYVLGHVRQARAPRGITGKAQSLKEKMMKNLSIMLVVMILAGCSSMSSSGGSGSSGMSSSESHNQMNLRQYDDPKNVYYGGGGG